MYSVKSVLGRVAKTFGLDYKWKPHIEEKNNLQRLFVAKWNGSQWSEGAGTMANAN